MKLIHYEIGDEDNGETICEGERHKCQEILLDLMMIYDKTARASFLELVDDFCYYINCDDIYEIVE